MYRLPPESIHREPVAHEGKQKEKAELQPPEPDLPDAPVAEDAEDQGPEHPPIFSNLDLQKVLIFALKKDGFYAAGSNYAA